ncbi:MAG: hypothetical protein LBR53_07170 [Deltaproteobacteria bacterium]|nr:hypothetical protein [Deltaproteobacteria bacterium]
MDYLYSGFSPDHDDEFKLAILTRIADLANSMKDAAVSEGNTKKIPQIEEVLANLQEKIIAVSSNAAAKEEADPIVAPKAKKKDGNADQKGGKK